MNFVVNKLYNYFPNPDSEPIEVKLLDFHYDHPVKPCFIQYLNMIEGDFGFRRTYCEAEQLEEI